VQRGMSGYCYHGGGGEALIYGLYFGWPLVLVHVLLSIPVIKTIGRVKVIVITSTLPAVLITGLLPCA
jgi:hypothetical protein